MKTKMNPVIFGALGLFGMVVFYYVLLAGVTRDAVHPVFFFAQKWYFLAPLFLGFGIQMFLFQKLRIVLHTLSIAAAGASAGTSGAAMVACCAHHLADILPILGFMGAAAFMTDYVNWFLMFGVIMNIGGAVYMWMKLNNANHRANSSSNLCCSHG